MASACTDQQLAILNVVLYSHPDMDVYGTARGFQKFSVDRDDESGFMGIIFTKVGLRHAQRAILGRRSRLAHKEETAINYQSFSGMVVGAPEVP